MNSKLVILAVAFLALQASAQKIVNCNSNSDCTNFDGTNTLSCCYTLRGTNIATGAQATQKLCDYTGNPGFSRYAQQMGFASVSGTCESSSAIQTMFSLSVAFLLTMLMIAF